MEQQHNRITEHYRFSCSHLIGRYSSGKLSYEDARKHLDLMTNNFVTYAKENSIKDTTLCREVLEQYASFLLLACKKAHGSHEKEFVYCEMLDIAFAILGDEEGTREEKLALCIASELCPEEHKPKRFKTAVPSYFSLNPG